MKTVVIGMSGGVDSAVSAYLLKKAGFEVIGLFMKNWEDDDDTEYCSSRQDFLDAASAADVIGIVCAAVTAAGVKLGRMLGSTSLSGNRAAILGGLVLIGIGVKILHEHGVL